MNIFRSSHKTAFGFTLVELLIVVSIIGILTTVGTIVYSSVNKNSRDQKRIRDLNILKQALEVYRNEHKRYPSSTGVAGWDLSSGEVLEYVRSDGNTSVYIESTQVPRDPLPENPPYKYKAIPDACTNNCSNYCLYAKVENSANSNISTSSCPVEAGYNYAVTSS